MMIIFYHPKSFLSTMLTKYDRYDIIALVLFVRKDCLSAPGYSLIPDIIIREFFKTLYDVKHNSNCKWSFKRRII